MTTLKKFFFGPPNPGCYTKNPYKHPLFFLDSYSPSHKLSIKPLNGCPSTKKKITGGSPLNFKCANLNGSLGAFYK